MSLMRYYQTIILLLLDPTLFFSKACEQLFSNFFNTRANRKRHFDLVLQETAVMANKYLLEEVKFIIVL